MTLESFSDRNLNDNRKIAIDPLNIYERRALHFDKKLHLEKQIKSASLLLGRVVDNVKRLKQSHQEIRETIGIFPNEAA